ncbi:MAG: hypothetical protein NVS3B26_11570 [Mycobacteriales bacterium]
MVAFEAGSVNAARPLGVTSDPVTAVRLDDWLQIHPLKRVDMIEIDVEGDPRAGRGGAIATALPASDGDRAKFLLRNDLLRAGPCGLHPCPAQHFDVLHIVEPGGKLSEPLTRWEQLSARLACGRGWEEPVLHLCRPRPTTRPGRLISRR